MSQAELERIADSVLSEMMGAIALGVLAVAGLVLLFLYRQRAKRQRRRDLMLSGLTIDDLKGMEKKGLLSPEELKKVRSAMARQFMETDTAPEPTELPPGVSGLEALAMEAERTRLKALAQGERAAGKSTPREKPAVPAKPSASAKHEAPVVPRSPLSPDVVDPGDLLPSHLKALVHKPVTELEDLVNAGFIEAADVRRILAARGESP